MTTSYLDALAASYLVGFTADELVGQLVELSIRLDHEVAMGDQKAALNTQYQLVLTRNEVSRRLGSTTVVATDDVSTIRDIVRQNRG